MGLFVNTNVSSLNAQRQLFNSSKQLSVAYEQLSSGFRINRAADDAAGLQISDRLTSQISGLNQSISSANDGISLVQTAEGALGETTRNLQRLRQLAIQAQNGINSQADKNALQKEANQLLNEINRVQQTTQFAGKTLLDGTFSAQFLVGANGGQHIDVGLTQFSGAGFGLAGLGVQGLNVTQGAVAASINSSDISGAVAFGSGHAVYAFAVHPPTATGTYKFAVSNDGGSSYSEISVNLQAGGAPAVAISNAGAFTDAVNNALGSNVLFRGSLAESFLDGSHPNLRIAAASNNPAALNGHPGIGSYTSAGESGQGALAAIDGALSRVNGVRAELGATQNRFQSTIRNLSNIAENISASRSRIQDTDYATATAELSRNQIIQQASTSVLAQANQRPQAALTLLG